MKGDQSYRNKWPSPFAIVCGVLLLLSFLQYVFSPFKWLALGAVAVGIVPLILKAIGSLRNLRFDINVLMLIAVGGSIFLKDYWEAGTIVFLLNISEWLETRASHKATAVMSSLMNIAPQKAILADTGEEVDANDVKVNTRLAVKAGTMIPIDGIIVEGNCEVDEKALTGESFPVSKQLDSIVYAGTVNLNGLYSVKLTALAEACVVARMAKLVEEAQDNKSKTQDSVCVVAACLAAIPAALRVHNVDKWYHLALVVLVSACPCALILSTPVAAFCALSKAATSGLLVKGAEYLEILSTVKFVCFDKTGTITKGEFSVSNFDPLIDDDKLLYWVSSIESKSSHPMAAALVDYAKSHSFEPQPDNVEEFKDFPGEGIYGKIDGKDVYIGNQKIAVRAGCSQVLRYGAENGEGKSVGFIFLGSTLAGTFSLSDSCRIGVKEALEELKSMGIKTAMLTGDCQAAANHAQNQLGGALDVVHAELLPQDKATIIKEIQKESKTAMVGDGLNDAPALATADIGISMGVSGSALANETGHVILMSNDIRKIPVAVRLARKTRRKIFENIFIAVITKAAIIALAIAGHPLVWAAVLADVGTCLLVIFNSMLLLQGVSSKTTHHHHSSSSHNHAHCSSGSKVQNKCSDVGKKHGGCCGHDDNSQELKHLVKHCIPEATDKCCGHDAHEVKQVVQQPEQEKEKHGCCSHEEDDEIHEIKQVVQPHVTKDLESQKQSQCSHNEATHENEQLGKAVSSCCKNHGLKKRHISGCCKSFVYKCGGGFNKKGYLSEIVIE
ncbi:heavy metal atpase 2 [Artemisia annua]|uniref:Heavy metal atpase 2 n=1 Tax=Artemisia annua TaxID=35608 RepID=A0A2U1MJM8_ARTAN|nr:heavy metal atpase 2 [Artemisia annua]